ncbi:zinc metallopeptidase [Solibaculum mannosilyticum]|uniref:Zinc metallopeptidase n=1 Tax=Solibaculum mannosilyticum TaxID=2780922 RepID=A0A7I8CZZ4_9FIRM|nr:zinc metallopeptidase [Solibaculum mannosilyticum]MCO7136459.1 zinc metallopeptidase [[Clostridium] leptum]BCI60090.1 zinc metallopeptidase [Solibaculum mannosilyticum]CZT57250.1 Putative neutral zinc metallopeptidase [Eubacteriaceae bacterium CHKCI005]
MPYFYIDPYYIILVIPAILLSLLAQVRVKTTFHKYSQVGNYRGLTGAQAASRILQDNGITNVAVERVGGNLTDHFDPKAMVIRLSDSVYNSSSIAAVGVAAHEAGHAVQHAVGYAPIRIRNAIVPVVNFGSALSWPLVLFGILFSYSFLINIGIILFCATLVFQIITLPVEFNASSRAMAILGSSGMLSDQELKGARSVLTAAAMTYVAAVIVSIAHLLRLLLLTRGRRGD